MQHSAGDIAVVAAVFACAVNRLSVSWPSPSHSSSTSQLLPVLTPTTITSEAAANSSNCDFSYANYFIFGVVVGASVIVPIIRCYLSVILSFKN